MFHSFRMSFVTAALTALTVTVLGSLANEPQSSTPSRRVADRRAAEMAPPSWPATAVGGVRVIDLRRVAP